MGSSVGAVVGSFVGACVASVVPSVLSVVCWVLSVVIWLGAVLGSLVCVSSPPQAHRLSSMTKDKSINTIFFISLFPPIKKGAQPKSCTRKTQRLRLMRHNSRHTRKYAETSMHFYQSKNAHFFVLTNILGCVALLFYHTLFPVAIQKIVLDPLPVHICKCSYDRGSGFFMPVLSVFAPLLKGRFFGFYVNGITLADGMGIPPVYRACIRY